MLTAKVYVCRYDTSPYDKSKRAAFEKYCTEHGIPIPDKKDDGDGYYESDSTFVANLDTLKNCGFPFKVLEFINAQKTADVLKQYETEPTNLTQHITIDNDSALFQIDEVRVVEDYCTDMLTNELDAGWRILAICGAYKQRRPDYILGRVKSEGAI